MKLFYKKVSKARSSRPGWLPVSPQGDIAKIVRNIVTAQDNTSKVVDENGESLVDKVGTFSNESNDIRFQASSNNFSNFTQHKSDDGLTYVSEKNTKYNQTSLPFEGQESTDDGGGSDNLQQKEISGQGLAASVSR